MFNNSLFNSQKALSKRNWLWQIYGAIIQGKYMWMINLLSIVLCIAVLVLLIAKLCFNWHPLPHLRLLTIIISLLLLWRTIVIVKTLNKIYCLRKNEQRITWSQVVLLLVIGLFFISFVEFLNPKKDSVESILLGGAGLVLAWVFQDTIKSVAAFFYLRINGLLKIGDWIIVPGHSIDGKVKRISLTTTTFENWDTTTSSLPTYILHAEHFKNQQDMMEGKTFGRQMQKSFVVDTGWIHPLSENEIVQIRKKSPSFFIPLINNDISLGTLNITAFRKYVYQMLLNNPKVSHHPRLIVRWLEQKEEGLPLQLYIFLTETKLAAYEWEQSKIIEQVVEALPWFGLQLYQKPSGFDTSNNNICMIKEPAKYKKNYGNEQ